MVGSSNIDLIARVPRMPGPGETLIGSQFQMGYGGKGANQAVMAARLGAQVAVVTKVGSDIFGRDTAANFKAQGCDTQFVLVDDELFSGVAPITVDEVTGQNSIIIVPGANNGLLPADVRAASGAILGADVLICQLEIPLETTLEAFRIAKGTQGKSVLTILNPAPAAPLPDELLALTDILVPNEVEASMLLDNAPIEGLGQAVEAARKLRERGPKSVIITMGKNGAVLLEDGKEARSFPAQVVQAVDSTGAGDSFVGSLAYFLAAGRSMDDAVQRAIQIATRSVLKHGTQTSYPHRDEVLDILGE